MEKLDDDCVRDLGSDGVMRVVDWGKADGESGAPRVQRRDERLR